MRDEAKSIERCLSSIADQRFPADCLEVWLFDGGSVDATREIAGSFAAARLNWHVRDNPRLVQAAAWNLGIEAAAGEVIGIVSGHAELGADYVAEAVATLDRTGAQMVGGPVRAVGDGRVGRAIALAMSTPFGVGGATFRYLDREADVDTVFMGLCRREIYQRFRFDETMVRDQDDELSYRILDAGGRIVCNPAIVSSYRSRGSLTGLARQYADYGYWKVEVIRRHPRQVRMRHLVPALFVGTLTVGFVVATFWGPARPILGALVALYLASAIVATLVAGRNSPPGTRWTLPAVFATMHISYGLGMFGGLARVVSRAVSKGPSQG